MAFHAAIAASDLPVRHGDRRARREPAVSYPRKPGCFAASSNIRSAVSVVAVVGLLVAPRREDHRPVRRFRRRRGPGHASIVTDASAARTHRANAPSASTNVAGDPCSTIRPCSSAITRSARRAVGTRCAITIAVRPASNLLECLLHQRVGGRIEVRRRLVEHDHGRDRRGTRGRARRADAGLTRV